MNKDKRIYWMIDKILGLKFHRLIVYIKTRHNISNIYAHTHTHTHIERETDRY